MCLAHLVDEIQGSESCSLWAQDRTAPFNTLTGEDTLIAVGQLLVHAEEIADLATTYADITGRHVLVRTDIAIQLCHECLAEPHDLSIRATSDREIRTTFGTAHRQCGQRILEYLLKSQELQDGKVHGRVETQPALVRTDRTVELNAIADIDMYFSLVIHPWNTERDNTLWLYETFDQLSFFKCWVLIIYIFNRDQHFFYCL